MSKRRRRADRMPDLKASAVDNKADPWIVTFADMMSLLLTFFILLLAMADMDPGKLDEIMRRMSEALGGAKTASQDEVAKMKEVYNELEKVIRDDNLTQDVELTSDTRGIVLFARGGIIFKPGKAEFLKDAKYFLNDVGSVLRSVANKILVEGHTDDVPIKSRQFPSNWELSTARASAVIRYFIAKGGIAPSRCEAVGYAQYKPRFPPIPENRARNRRVEIVLVHGKF